MTLEPAYRAAVHACLWDLQQPRDHVLSLEESLDRNLRVGISAFLYHLAADLPDEMVDAAYEKPLFLDRETFKRALSAALRSIGGRP